MPIAPSIGLSGYPEASSSVPLACYQRGHCYSLEIPFQEDVCFKV